MTPSKSSFSESKAGYLIPIASAVLALGSAFAVLKMHDTKIKTLDSEVKEQILISSINTEKIVGTKEDISDIKKTLTDMKKGQDEILRRLPR